MSIPSDQMDLEEGEVLLPDPSSKSKKAPPPQSKKPKKQFFDPKDKPKNLEFVSSTYKTKPCEFFRKGGCHKGSECTFSHDFQPEKIKILCKYFLGGACNKPNCAFSHNLSEFPCKFFHVLGTCDAGTFCQFSHQALEEAELANFMRENEEFIKENLEKYGNIKIFSQFHAYLQDKKQQSRPPQSNYQLLAPVFEPNPDPNLEINMMLPPNPSNPMPLIQKMSQNSYYQDPKAPYPPSKPRFIGYNRPPPPMGSIPYPAQYTPETSNKPPYYYNNNPRMNNPMNEMNPPRMNPPLNQMNNSDINPRIINPPQMNSTNEYSSQRGNPPPQMNPTMNTPPQMNPTMNPPPQRNPIMNPQPQMNPTMNPQPQMNQPPQMNPTMNPTMNQPQMMNQPPQMEKRPMNYYDKYQQQPPPPYGTSGAYYPQEISHNNHGNNPNMGYYQHHQDRSFSAPKLSQPTFWTEESKNLQHGGTPYENYTNMPKPPLNYLKPSSNYNGYFPSQPATPPNDNIGTMGGQNQGTNSMSNMGYYNNNNTNTTMRIMTNNNNNPINNNNQRTPMPNINPYIKPGYNNNEMPPQNLPFSSNIFPMKPTNTAQNPSNIANFYENSSNFTN